MLREGEGASSSPPGGPQGHMKTVAVVDSWLRISYMLGDETRPSAYLNWSEGEFAWFLTSDADINYALLG